MPTERGGRGGVLLCADDEWVPLEKDDGSDEDDDDDELEVQEAKSEL